MDFTSNAYELTHEYGYKKESRKKHSHSLRLFFSCAVKLSWITLISIYPDT